MLLGGGELRVVGWRSSGLSARCSDAMSWRNARLEGEPAPARELGTWNTERGAPVALNALAVLRHAHQLEVVARHPVREPVWRPFVHLDLDDREVRAHDEAVLGFGGELEVAATDTDTAVDRDAEARFLVAALVRLARIQ